MADTSPTVELTTCWGYYAARAFNADPDTPLDRWAQAKDTRNLWELLDNLGPLVERYGVTTMVEPFTGLGSGALAARHLGLRYLGSEISPTRAGHASVKAFLTLDALDDVLPGLLTGQRSVPTGPGSAPAAPSFAPATPESVTAERAAPGILPAATVRATLDHLAARIGSTDEAVGAMRSDLATAGPPCRGEIAVGDFTRLDPTPADDDAALYLLCPPFPRYRNGGAPASPATDDIVHCRTPDEFEKLVRRMAAWLRSHVRDQDIVISEYFNFVPEYDTGSRLADLLSEAVPYLRVVAASARDQRGNDAPQATGYCGFILGNTADVPPMPPEWAAKN